MYTIEIIDHKIKSENWGAFKVKKGFNVSHPDIPKESISGYIIQRVEKQCKANVLTPDGLRRIEDIDSFTRGNVLHINESYYELFPVLMGESQYDDRFQNGAILHYEKNDNDTEWVANNNPPTIGIILQQGTCFFIPYSNADVTKINKAITTYEKNKKPITRKILGISWAIDEDNAANGLFYVNKAALLEEKRESPYVIHTVTATWDFREKSSRIKSMRHSTKVLPLSIKSVKNTSARKERTYISHKREERAKTKVTSTFTTMD
jgi:hypothetical protein